MMNEILKEGLHVSETEREKFVELTNKLIDIMVDFSLLTLKTVSNIKQTSLNNQQIEDVINFDLQFQIQQINDPELLDMVRERTFSEFLKM
jgi:hypothetical protein